jgi:hypothetical protein
MHTLRAMTLTQSHDAVVPSGDHEIARTTRRHSERSADEAAVVWCCESVEKAIKVTDSQHHTTAQVVWLYGVVNQSVTC